MLLVSFCNGFPRGFGLGLFDFDTGDFDWIDIARFGPECLGVDGLHVAADGVWCLPQIRPGGAAALARLGPNLTFDRVYPLSATRDAHDLVPHEDGFLVTDTAGDRVNFVRPGDGEHADEIEVWRGGAGDGDTVHVNALARLGADVYASMFGDRPAEGWAVANTGRIVRLGDGEIIADGLAHPHSLVARGDSLFWVESRQSTVYAWTAATGTRQVWRGSGYLRGLAWDGSVLYVAASARRRRSRSTGLPMLDVGDGDDAQSWIYRVEPETGRWQRRPLTPFGAEIFDLAVVDAPRSIAGRAQAAAYLRFAALEAAHQDAMAYGDAATARACAAEADAEALRLACRALAQQAETSSPRSHARGQRDGLEGMHGDRIVKFLRTAYRSAVRPEPVAGD